QVVQRPSEFNCQILALDIPRLAQSFSKSPQQWLSWSRRTGMQIADHGSDGLLCSRDQWPRSHPAAEQPDELAPPDHSITSSASARSLSGTVKPSAFAVLPLITSWNRVGCSTGSSAALAPRRILSTWAAERRVISSRSGP